MLELLEKLDYVNLLIAATIVTFFASALHTYFPKLYNSSSRKKLNVVIIAVFISILNLAQFARLEDITFDIYLQKLFFTWSFSVLFYQILGKWVIDKIFLTIKSKLE